MTKGRLQASVRSASEWEVNQPTLTDERNHLNFLSKLILVTSSYPVAVSTIVRHISNSSKHVTRGHDERGNDCYGCPWPFILHNRRNKFEKEKWPKKATGDSDPAYPVDGGLVRNRDRSEPWHKRNKWGGFKSSNSAYVNRWNQDKYTADILWEVIFYWWGIPTGNLPGTFCGRIMEDNWRWSDPELRKAKNVKFW